MRTGPNNSCWSSDTRSVTVITSFLCHSFNHTIMNSNSNVIDVTLIFTGQRYFRFVFY